MRHQDKHSIDQSRTFYEFFSNLLELQSFDGANLTLTYSANPGQAMLLFIMSARCGVCGPNIEHWNSLGRDLAPLGTEFVGIGIDSLVELRTFLLKNNPAFPVYSAAYDPRNFARLKLFSVPQTLLIDGDGIIRGVWVGLLDLAGRNEIVSRVSSLRQQIELPQPKTKNR